MHKNDFYQNDFGNGLHENVIHLGFKQYFKSAEATK